MSIFRPLRRYTLAMLILLFASRSWAEASLQSRYEQIKQGLVSTLPGTTIALTSTEEDELLSAEVTSIVPHAYDRVAAALAEPANWCRFMPLHFNIKACTHDSDSEGRMLHIYSGRKQFQAPHESYLMEYRFNTLQHDNRQLQIQLNAERGPAKTRNYRIELTAQPVEEGTLLLLRSSYRPNMLSSLLTASYLSTLGRDKVGFSRSSSSAGDSYVKGIRGVIERNVMRYHIAIDAFLASKEQRTASAHEAMLAYWFDHNDSYAQQLHEMPRQEYLSIKHREWRNQQQLQQEIDRRAQLVAVQSIRQ